MRSSTEIRFFFFPFPFLSSQNRKTTYPSTTTLSLSLHFQFQVHHCWTQALDLSLAFALALYVFGYGGSIGNRGESRRVSANGLVVSFEIGRRWLGLRSLVRCSAFFLRRLAWSQRLRQFLSRIWRSSGLNFCNFLWILSYQEFVTVRCGSCCNCTLLYANLEVPWVWIENFSLELVKQLYS